MTREQAEKLRQENRRKRLRKKRIKAFSLLALFIVLAAAVLFFAVKGIAYLMTDGEDENTDNPIGTAGVVDSNLTAAAMQTTKTSRLQAKNLNQPQNQLQNRYQPKNLQAPHLLAQNPSRAGAPCWLTSGAICRKAMCLT